MDMKSISGFLGIDICRLSLKWDLGSEADFTSQSSFEVYVSNFTVSTGKPRILISLNLH
jgi:hypothetical protein